MGWTHDNRDLARKRGAPRRGISSGYGAAPLRPPRPDGGIPRLLGRRARWVSARLRHVRG
ncbi:hypothetical protein E0L36_22350 [Streptomyces sp. AJS327]|nr:hypothetical protein [Streptomyces sp. AJS327]MBA0053518.1 hypothetical protein [Streptomyces sp. AJS327]